MILNLYLYSGYIDEYKALLERCCCREIALQRCCAAIHRSLLVFQFWLLMANSKNIYFIFPVVSVPCR